MHNGWSDGWSDGRGSVALERHFLFLALFALTTAGVLTTGALALQDGSPDAGRWSYDL